MTDFLTFTRLLILRNKNSLFLYIIHLSHTICGHSSWSYLIYSIYRYTRAIKIAGSF